MRHALATLALLLPLLPAAARADVAALAAGLPSLVVTGIAESERAVRFIPRRIEARGEGGAFSFIDQGDRFAVETTLSLFADTEEVAELGRRAAAGRPGFTARQAPLSSFTMALYRGTTCVWLRERAAGPTAPIPARFVIERPAGDAAEQVQLATALTWAEELDPIPTQVAVDAKALVPLAERVAAENGGLARETIARLVDEALAAGALKPEGEAPTPDPAALRERLADLLAPYLQDGSVPPRPTADGAAQPLAPGLAADSLPASLDLAQPGRIERTRAFLTALPFVIKRAPMPK